MFRFSFILITMRESVSKAIAECDQLFISKTFTMNLFLSPNSRRSSHNLFHYIFCFIIFFQWFFCLFATHIAVTAVVNVSAGVGRVKLIHSNTCREGSKPSQWWVKGGRGLRPKPPIWGNHPRRGVALCTVGQIPISLEYQVQPPAAHLILE